MKTKAEIKEAVEILKEFVLHGSTNPAMALMMQSALSALEWVAGSDSDKHLQRLLDEYRKLQIARHRAAVN